MKPELTLIFSKVFPKTHESLENYNQTEKLREYCKTYAPAGEEGADYFRYFPLYLKVLARTMPELCASVEIADYEWTLFRIQQLAADARMSAPKLRAQRGWRINPALSYVVVETPPAEHAVGAKGLLLVFADLKSDEIKIKNASVLEAAILQEIAEEPGRGIDDVLAGVAEMPHLGVTICRENISDCLFKLEADSAVIGGQA